eukprot:jgi/Bigna1/142701/aug1.72_g17409
MWTAIVVDLLVVLVCISHYVYFPMIFQTTKLGSVRDETLLELMKDDIGATMAELEEMRVQLNDKRTLSQCFKIFGLIHKVVKTHAAITRITVEVLEDFSNDGVRYVELRTTPRIDAKHNMTQESYVEAVLKAATSILLNEFHSLEQDFTSLRIEVEIAHKTVALAKAYQTCKDRRNQGVVVGVDFSGNPHAGSFAQFRPAFEAAKKAGLRCAIHCAEIEAEDEVEDILRFGADRLGHAIVMSTNHKELLSKMGTPVEICPTSNMRTLQILDIKQHPTLGLWLQNGHPFSICTDDFGVFRTSLSEETRLVATAFGLSLKQVADISLRALEMAFIPDKDELCRLRKRFETEINAILISQEKHEI